MFILLAMWAGLAFLTWKEGKMPLAMRQNLVQNPVFAVLLSPQTDLPEIEPPDIDVDLALKNDPSKPGSLLDDKGGDKSDDMIKNQTKNPTKNPTKDPSKADGKKTDGKADAQQTGDKKTDHEKNGDGKTEGENEPAGVTRFRGYKKVKTDSPYYSDPGVMALTTDYDYKNVEKDYFDDAVFIGDSRTVGMQDYSGLDNAAFFAKTGMNVYEILEDKFIKDGGKDVSVSDMLKKKSYKKIYLMIGINELGTGNTATFQKAYARVLEKFRKWQPNAVIYIQGIIPVSKKKAQSDGIFNNVNINDKNVAIAQLADGKHIFYLDVSEKLVDKHGFLREDYTFDDVHMYAQNYKLWTDYLMQHAVVRE